MVDFSLASKLVQSRVETAMVSTVEIRRGDLSAMDPDTLLVGGIQNASVIYTGKAHVHNVQGAGVISVGENNVDTRTVQISIPLSATTPHRDDIVTVLDDNDPDLPNRHFRVMDVNVGGLLNNCHTMTCQGYFESRYWA